MFGYVNLLFFYHFLCLYYTIYFSIVKQFFVLFSISIFIFLLSSIFQTLSTHNQYYYLPELYSKLKLYEHALSVHVVPKTAYFRRFSFNSAALFFSFPIYTHFFLMYHYYNHRSFEHFPSMSISFFRDIFLPKHTPLQ